MPAGVAPGRPRGQSGSHQRSWDHENLYVVGAGSSPTIATSNPTLTLTALALRAADGMLADLGEERP